MTGEHISASVFGACETCIWNFCWRGLSMKHIFLKDTCTWVSIWMFKEQFSVHAFHVEYCNFKSLGSVYMFIFFFNWQKLLIPKKYIMLYIWRNYLFILLLVCSTPDFPLKLLFPYPSKPLPVLNVQWMWNIIHNTPWINPLLSPQKSLKPDTSFLMFKPPIKGYEKEQLGPGTLWIRGCQTCTCIELKTHA